jgi:hypothetical protein
MRPVSRVRTTWVFAAFGVIAAFFLATEHRAHLFGLLPYVLLLACPLLHLFSHGRHGGHGGHHDGLPRRSRGEAP